MTTAPKRIVSPEQRRRENRLIGTTLAFIAIGPPIGMLTMFFFTAADELLNTKILSFAEVVAFAVGAFVTLLSSLLYTPWSYLFGAVPAALAGALVGYLSISDRFSWWLALLIGLAVGCLWFSAFF